MIARHTIPAAGAIKNLDFAAANGRTRMFTNSADRVLREFVLPAVYAPPAADGLPRDVELEPLHRYLDPINRTAWAGLALSRGGGLLASADMTLHKIHIWETRDGRFVTTLDGGREALADVHVRSSCT
jgi:COMPASS component SWD1